MDKELIESITEKITEIETEEVVEGAAIIEEIEETMEAEEATVEAVEAETVEEIEIGIEEAVGWTGGDDNTRHYSLYGRDEDNQHPISAITGLRAELDEIEKLKTVQSDKVNVANYYKWKDGAYDEYGYFVSLVSDTSTIEICNGTDIFGVSVDVAGFVGGQDADIPRDNSYGLIATSGLVDVRCEFDIEVGDYVTANAYGYAKKAESNYGYKVLAKENKHGVEYAVIALGVQADMTNTLGAELDAVEKRVSVNEQNIVSAINVSNQAYNKAESAATSASASKEAVEEALKDVLGFGDTLDEMEKTVTSSNVISAQAKAIAESAATSAASMRNEAVETANEAWTNTNNLIETLKPITEWEKDGISGADYLATQMDDGIATTYDVKVVDDKLEVAQSAIIRNGKELQSLMTVVDKYSVGPYSQAYGFTLEQATSIVEPGMMYVPTSHENFEVKTKHHTEEYENDNDAPTSPRTFVPEYLYQWGRIGEHYGWITVDKNNNPIDYDETAEEHRTNIAGRSVYFSSQLVPNIVDNPQYGYWYTDGDTSSGAAKNYKPYTLYKWEKPEDEDGYWFAVATLAGNSSNRAVSQIRQKANEISLEVTTTKGDVAKVAEKVSATEADVSSLAAWRRGDKSAESNESIIRQISNDDGANITISTYQRSVDGSIKEQASLVLSVSENNPSTLVVDADNVLFKTDNYSTIANNIILDASRISINGETTFTYDEGAGGITKTVINGGYIGTETIEARSLSADAISAISASISNTLSVENDDGFPIFYASTVDKRVNIGDFVVTKDSDHTQISYITEDIYMGSINRIAEIIDEVKDLNSDFYNNLINQGQNLINERTAFWDLFNNYTVSNIDNKEILEKVYNRSFDSFEIMYQTICGIPSTQNGYSLEDIKNIVNNLRNVMFELLSTIGIDKPSVFGWATQTPQLYKGIYIGSDGMAVSSGDTYCTISHEMGLLATNNVLIDGGTIGGWEIDPTHIKKTYSVDADTYEIMLNGVLNPDIPVVGESTCIEVQKNDLPVFYVRPTGYLYASTGKIGGWEIYDDGESRSINYFDKKKNIGTGIQPPNSSEWAIAVGYTNQANWETAPFRVTHEGNVYAKTIAFDTDYGIDSKWYDASSKSSDLATIIEDIYEKLAILKENIKMDIFG